MDQQEGAIKFQLHYTPAPPLPSGQVWELNAWRRILHLTGLIGQDPRRYDGYGYGNISERCRSPGTEEFSHCFVITATQTGLLAHLGSEHYVTVLDSFPERNLIIAVGPFQPSSEAMTHAALYHADDAIRGVAHAHCPEVWRRARAMGIASTDPAVSYGTPEMAQEVAQLVRHPGTRERQILAMGGHLDGIITFGRSVEDASLVMLRYLARALER